MTEIMQRGKLLNIRRMKHGAVTDSIFVSLDVANEFSRTPNVSRQKINL
jgi:hypothetical protein